MKQDSGGESALQRIGHPGDWSWNVSLEGRNCRNESDGVGTVISLTQTPSVSRPGAFTANFAPDVLDRFRVLCKQQGKQYTKVLQLLAELYLETEGAVLDGKSSLPPVDPERKKRQVQVESLQNKLLEDLLKRVELLEKQKVKTDYELDRVQKSVAFIQSGLQEPR